MACMANITSQKAGFLGSQYLQMLEIQGGFVPLNPPQGPLPLDPAGGLRRPPARLVTPYHLKITCFNKRKQEPCGRELSPVGSCPSYPFIDDITF